MAWLSVPGSHEVSSCWVPAVWKYMCCVILKNCSCNVFLCEKHSLSVTKGQYLVCVSYGFSRDLVKALWRNNTSVNWDWGSQEYSRLLVAQSLKAGNGPVGLLRSDRRNQIGAFAFNDLNVT